MKIEHKEEVYEYDFPCVKIAKNPLNKDCVVDITDPQIQDDGFFS